MTPRSFIAASLLTCQNLIADQAPPSIPPCIQAESIVDACKYLPAFNAPAVIDLDRHRWMSNLFVDASFLYWRGSEEGLTVAVNGVWNTSGGLISSLSIITNPLIQNFDYHPGFKVGLGFVTDHQWQCRAEYTWLRGSNSMSQGAPTLSETAGSYLADGLPVWIVEDWVIQGTSNNQNLVGSYVSSTWKYTVDFLDAVVSRPYYQGSSVSINPFGGLRAAWISQSMLVGLTEIPSMFAAGSLPPQPIYAQNNSQCWGLGPRIGFDGSCLFPLGFRLEGSLATDILFTQYTKISHSEEIASTDFNPGPYLSGIENYNTIRAMAELGLGLGWGQYFACNKYHLDFSATYDFTYMWRQNMMRLMTDEIVWSVASAASDFFLHGLTLNGRFDF